MRLALTPHLLACDKLFCQLMSRMHKPDPKLPTDQQDKRSVIPFALEDYYL
jgi:hypothetical protein